MASPAAAANGKANGKHNAKFIDPSKAGSYPVILSDKLLGKHEEAEISYTSVICELIPSQPSRATID